MNAELAGKAFLRSFGKPFQFLAEGYDEWHLDEKDQMMGLALVKGPPNWGELETMDGAARALAEGIAERFKKQYYRLLNQRQEE
ncbi:MAG: hypothetical protein ACRD21_21590, partial [Vicinamibacteria bacterium]